MDVKQMLRSRFGYAGILGASVALGMAVTTAVHAQEELQPDEATQESEGAVRLDAVTVTGSRIKQANLESTSPMAIVNDTEIKYQGTTRVEDLINSMPQAFGDQGGNLSNGSTGTATVNLRNIGAERTLVLIDGKRMNSGDPRDPVADLNTIPAALIERVEIVTGGASAVYGSDAVAGVVNFIMKKDFEGTKLDYQHSFYMHNNNDDEAKARLTAAGYAQPDSNVLDGEGDNLSAVFGIGGTEGGNATLFFNYRSLKEVTQGERDFSACAIGDPSRACRGSGTTYPTHFLAFNADFTDVRDLIIDQTTGDTLRDFTSPDDTFNYAPFNYFQRNNENLTLGANLRRPISDYIDVYGNISFTEDKTNGVIAPSGVFGTVATLRCDNPLLSADQKQKLCTDLGYADTDTANVYLLRRNIEGGPRNDDLTHQNFRSVFGVEGDVGSNWSFDVFGQYSKARLNEIYKNDMSVTRQNRAVDATTDADGNIVCRSVVDGTDPNCVVYNIFDTNTAPSQEALDYIQVPGLLQGSTEQRIVAGNMTGTIDSLIVPSADAPVGVAFGIEHREEEASFETDQAYSSGDLAGQGGATIGTGGAFDVTEVYGEARIPLVQDAFLLHDLTMEVGYRFSDYSSAGTSDTYKVQMNWSPIPDLTVRGGYNKAVRAPNIVEIATPTSVALAGDTDPCSGETPDRSAEDCANDPFFAANPNRYGTITPNPANQYNGLYGTSPGLKPEEADTYTAGIVYTPDFLKDFSVTLDYYNIEVTGLIGTYGADQILNACYDGNTEFCSLIHRDPQTGSLWLNTNGYTDVRTLNTGSIKVNGVDLAMAYRYDLGEELGVLHFDYIGTTNLDETNEPIPGLGTYQCEGKYGSSCGVPKPKYRHKLRTRWAMPWYGIESSLAWRYMGGVDADDDSLTESLGAVNYFDLAATVPFMGAGFRVGLSNVLDQDPPSSINANAPRGNGNTFPQVYDTLGRYVFVGVDYQF